VEYTVLNAADKSTLVQQRVLQLESDHYKLELLIQEEVSEEEAARMLGQQAEIARRLELYCGAPMTPESTSDEAKDTAERP
jgi:hypothetical protein